jgi:hypothetical protein
MTISYIFMFTGNGSEAVDAFYLPLKKCTVPSKQMIEEQDARSFDVACRHCLLCDIILTTTISLPVNTKFILYSSLNLLYTNLRAPLSSSSSLQEV